MRECYPDECGWLAARDEDVARLRDYNRRLLAHIAELEEGLIQEMEAMRDERGYMPVEDRRTLIQNYVRPKE